MGLDGSDGKAGGSFSSGSPGTPVCACGGHADPTRRSSNTGMDVLCGVATVKPAKL